MKLFFTSIFSVFIMMVIIVPCMAEDPVLYGIVRYGDIIDAGYLISIDLSTGDATPIDRTTVSWPGGLAYSRNTGILYAVDALGGQVSIINPNDGSTTDLPFSTGIFGPEALAHRYVDNLLYTTSTDPIPNLYKIDAASGVNLEVVGSVGAGGVDGLSVRPSDGVLFGAGTDGVDEILFTLSIEPGPFPTIRNYIGDTGRVVRALAFHPDGTLYATDGEFLFTLDPATGGVIEEIGAFGADIGHVTGLAVATPYTPGPVDVWIKDCSDDDGTVPSSDLCPQWWTSTDIWIDNDNDMEIDAPVVGEDNILKALVRNRESGTTSDVGVKFYYRDNTTGLTFPDGADFIDEDIVTIPPNGIALASVVWEDLPAPPSTDGHWCIGVVLDHSDDHNILPAVLPPNDNNVGIANLWFIAGRSGEDVTLDFNVGSSSKSGYNLKPWPRDFIIRVIDELPDGWGWTLEGIAADEPITFRLGEIRAVKLKVQVADDAPPHEGGAVKVQQVDVLTGKIVGGVEYNLYEDHMPPEAVQTVKGSVIDNKVELTWQPVLKEFETKLKERVSYYEILRDGKPTAKALRDENRFKTGIQWTDTETACGKSTYAVRVVDEGGNISEASPDVMLTVPCDNSVFNRITLLLTFLILILLVLLIICHRRKKKTG